MNQHLRFLFIITVCFASLCSFAIADVRLPAIVSDHMILQQETAAPIWGWADVGEEVTVVGSWGNEASAVAGKNGRWQVELETPSFGTGHSLTIRGNNTHKISNVAIGEVWLCAGQSNMGWRLTFTEHGPEDQAAANHPDFRIFRSERAHHHKPQDDVIAQWAPCTPETAGTCSAVSFYFAEKLHKELGIPVGVVVQAYAGTPIEGWMPRDIQLNDPRTSNEIKADDTESASYDIELAKKQLARATEAFKKGERRLAPKLREPRNWGHQYPSNIFNGMIHPVRPYGIRGAIWYQGERNAKDVAQAANYENQLPRLINYYRSSWHELSGGSVDDNFPFYFVQLPCWHPAQTEPVEANAAWAVSRDMMRRVASTLPNTGVAVAIDTGDPYMLHPKNKKSIGLRLAYLALKRTYDKDFVEYGPFYNSYQIDGDKIVLTFDTFGSDMVKVQAGPLNSFAIAGADRKFVWADAEIKGNTVVVSAKGIEKPAAVRYAWAMNPMQRNLLYNQVGIPASPFRTDDWPLFDASTYDPPEQLKPKEPAGYEPPVSNRPKMTQ